MIPMSHKIKVDVRSKAVRRATVDGPRRLVLLTGVQLNGFRNLIIGCYKAVHFDHNSLCSKHRPVLIYRVAHFRISSCFETQMTVRFRHHGPWSKTHGWPCTLDWMTQFWSCLVEFHKIKLKQFQLIQALLLIRTNTKTWGKIMLFPLLPSHRNEQTKIISSSGCPDSSVGPWVFGVQSPWRPELVEDLVETKVKES